VDFFSFECFDPSCLIQPNFFSAPLRVYKRGSARLNTRVVAPQSSSAAPSRLALEFVEKDDHQCARENYFSLLPKALEIQDKLEVVKRLASEIQRSSRQAIRERGSFHLAVSGGSTPSLLFDHLAVLSLQRSGHRIDWENTHVWLVDERCVGADDNRSNSKLVKERLVEKVGLRPNNFHTMQQAALPSASDHAAALEWCGEGAQKYQQELRDTFEATGADKLDFVVLGLGKDGHTASLFPGRFQLILVPTNDSKTKNKLKMSAAPNRFPSTENSRQVGQRS